MEAAVRNQLVEFSRTFLTLAQGFVGNLLKDLFNSAASVTLVFINGHYATVSLFVFILKL
jgi:hypothetical protein